MESGIVLRQEENQALLSQVVDSKLTRTELLDLIVDRVATELRTEHEKLREERKALDTDLPLSAAVALARARSPKVEMQQISEWAGSGVERRDLGHTLTITVRLAAGVALPAKYLAARAAAKALDKRITEVASKLQRLQMGKSRARNEMVKQALENSPEGKRILEAIDALKDSMKAKLIGAGA